MSVTNDTSSLITGFPLAAHGPAGVVLDFLGGGVLAAAGWGGLHFLWPQATELVHPLMLVGYWLTGMVFVGAGRELLDSIRQRRAIPAMTLTPSGKGSLRNPSDRRQPASGRDQAVWSQILEELQHHPHRYERWEMPGILVALYTYWRETLEHRSLAGIVLAACVLILGLFAGLSRLELSRAGAYLDGFSTVFSPLIVSSVLATMAVATILIARFHWNGTLLRWQKKSHDLIFDRIEAEELARQEEQPKTLRVTSPHPSFPTTGLKTSKNQANILPGVPEKFPVTSPLADQDEIVAPVEEAPDPWGAWPDAAGGVKVRDRKELDQVHSKSDVDHE